MNKTLIMILILLMLPCVIDAQTFNSGSTGADGALDLTSGDREVQLPESGILNYTTVNIPTGKTLRFKKNLRNTPVIMLASGAITIGGIVDVSAPSSCAIICSGDREPGPGGFYGGGVNQDGLGPGGGKTVPGGYGGAWVGPLSLVPIIGGSGGAGISSLAGNYVGGGGGGAIVVASSSSIVILSGSIIQAKGSCPYNGSCGASGAIRIVANSVDVRGALSASVNRLEAPQGALSFTGAANAPAVLSPINPVIIPSAAPSLNIISIGGFPVPSYAGQRFDTVDLMLPRQLSDPINIVVQASNIPVGSPVKVTFLVPLFTGSPAVTTSTLAGTLASSTATLTVSGLDKGGAVTYLFVSTTFDLPQTSQSFNRKGKDEIAHVRIEAAPGAKQKVTFLRRNGTEIDLKNIPVALRQQFGQ